MLPVTIVSLKTLENWDDCTPWVTGIGGSEQSHLEMAPRLKDLGVQVTSFIPHDRTEHKRNALIECNTKHSDDFKGLEDPGILINYRAPDLFNGPKPTNQSWWFIAQDVDYAWLGPNLEKIDRYVCLCQEHAKYTLARYPELKDKVVVSSNGVRSSYLNSTWDKPDRVPYSMFYASSPDRGLKQLLELWPRIKERFPKATLRVAYGFNNMEVIAEANKGQSWHSSYQQELLTLSKQPGVVFLGRLPLNKLYDEWFKASLWAHPSDWPETSCISCMDAQACGAFPVTNNFWAVGENVKHGWMVDGVPQQNELVRTLWLENLYDALERTANLEALEPERQDMMTWARRNFNWDNFAKQWLKWIKDDSDRLESIETAPKYSPKPIEPAYTEYELSYHGAD